MGLYMYVRENRPSDVCPTKSQISMCIYAVFVVLMKNFESLAIQKVASKDSDQTECLCWGFTAQSTQWGHVERGQFT